jgi:putative flippase GtrA
MMMTGLYKKYGGAKVQLISELKPQIRLRKKFLMYGIIGAFVTVIDVLVCMGSEVFSNAVIANTFGVVTGFIIQYFLTAKHVYNEKT